MSMTNGHRVVAIQNAGQQTATPQDAQAEAAALAAWAHTGAAVRLIDVHIGDCALLLDRIQPGAPLPGGDDPAAVQVVAGLLSRLHRAAPAALPFPALEEIYVLFEAQARDDAACEQRTSGDPTRGAAGLRRLDAARAAAVSLCATTEQAVLLHGDFLDKNLLLGRAGYVAIDPIPGIGDPLRARRLLRRLPSARHRDPAASRGHSRAHGPGPAPRATMGRGLDRPAGLSGLARRPIRP